MRSPKRTGALIEFPMRFHHRLRKTFKLSISSQTRNIHFIASAARSVSLKKVRSNGFQLKSCASAPVTKRRRSLHIGRQKIGTRVKSAVLVFHGRLTMSQTTVQHLLAVKPAAQPTDRFQAKWPLALWLFHSSFLAWKSTSPRSWGLCLRLHSQLGLSASQWQFMSRSFPTWPSKYRRKERRDSFWSLLPRPFQESAFSGRAFLVILVLHTRKELPMNCAFPGSPLQLFPRLLV
ncbi:hypothetical protein BJY00DRAFT_286002 [Aspergillus carlsbadensis]|nr:hypothetical protein BJY00DRAFT_286002 [Aspergillus carlsbadensis]